MEVMELRSLSLDGQKIPGCCESRFVTLRGLMLERKVRPFALVMNKVMKRYLAEVEMRKKYPDAVCQRYREFKSFGRTLDFALKDFECDEGAARDDAEDKWVDELTSTTHAPLHFIPPDIPVNHPLDDASHSSLEKMNVDECNEEAF